MQKDLKITKFTDNKTESYVVNVRIEKSVFEELTNLYELTAGKNSRYSGSQSLIFTNSNGEGLTWKAESLKIRKFNPYIVLNDVRRLELGAIDNTNYPNTAEAAENELSENGFKIKLQDNSTASSKDGL